MLPFDPFSDDAQRDPYPLYRRLRDEDPVHHNPDTGLWFLFRFDDVLAAAHDPDHFVSGRGISLVEVDPAVPQTLIGMDNPRHDLLRGAVSRLFTPRSIGRFESLVQQLAREHVDRFTRESKVELMQSLAIPLPIIVVGDLIGVEAADREQFRIWSDDLVHQNPARPETVERGKESRQAISDYFAHVIEARRRCPSQDIVSTLLAARIDGEPLATVEIVMFCFLLIVAGTETTTNLIANAVMALAAHPDQRRELARDRALVANAVEETLRWDSPVQGLSRVTATDVTIRDITIPAGARVQLRYGAANRDEREFEDPDRFDLARNIRRHLSFGHGVHYCLGAALARLEGRIVLEELVARHPEWELLDDDVERWPSGEVRGPHRLHLALG